MLLYDVLKKSNKGFTLIEMIATVIIVGIIASIAAPNLLGMLNQTRVKDSLGQVEGAIKEAQKLAVRRGKTCIVRFTSTGSGSNKQALAQISPDQTISGNTVNSDGCLLSTRTFDNEITLEFDDGSTVEEIDSTNTIDILFTGKGNTTTDGDIGTIIVSHTGTNTKKCLQIEGLLGNIVTGNYNSTATPKCEAN